MSKRQHGGARWPATDHAIAEAMRIIAPPDAQSAECRAQLEGRYNMLVMASVNRYWAGLKHTKRAKAAARRLSIALHRVELTLNAVKDDLQLPTRGGPIAEIKEWRKRCDEDARATTAPRLALEQPEKLAVACLGVDLLRRYGGKVTVTPGGQLNKLTGVLLGNPGGNYTWVCRKARKARAERGAK